MCKTVTNSAYKQFKHRFLPVKTKLNANVSAFSEKDIAITIKALC